MFGNDDQNAQTNSFGPPQGDPSADNSFGGAPQDNNPQTSAPMVSAPSDNGAFSAPAGGSDDLLGIKQQALQHLSPLVGHLEQNPEEKFRTTMMMIQASDDQSLVKEAFEAAQKITDDKARAQALLDVINEINYFTQQHNSQG